MSNSLYGHDDAFNSKSEDRELQVKAEPSRAMLSIWSEASPIVAMIYIAT